MPSVHPVWPDPFLGLHDGSLHCQESDQACIVLLPAPPAVRYGMFKQLIKDGYQAEVPDIWLEQGNPWEIKRHDIRFEVGFSGKTVTDKGKTTWIPGERVGAL